MDGGALTRTKKATVADADRRPQASKLSTVIIFLELGLR
jgi:hypothetical protein